MDTHDSAADRIINEEYKIWKKNTPFLYDYVHTEALDWPSLTCQWIPFTQENPKIPNSNDDTSKYKKHNLILGTHTDNSENAQNQLLIASTLIPHDHVETSKLKYNSDMGEFGGYTSKHNASLKIEVRINHDGEVNRARYCPQKPDLIATKSPSSKVYLFDYNRHPSKPSEDNNFKPEMTLTGHTAEGYGLSWNHKHDGRLLSCGDDKTICYWDVNGVEKKGELHAHTGG